MIVKIRKFKSKISEGSIVFLLLAIVFCFSSNFPSNFFLAKRPVDYLLSAQNLQLISGSFRPLFSQMIVIKGILDIPEQVSGRMAYFTKIFKTAIILDPKISSAYFLGGLVIAQSNQELDQAIEFLKQVREYNPDDWRIPSWIGFNYYQLQDYLQAAQYYQQAGKLPGAPNYLKTNQAFLYYQAGRPDLGAMYLRGLLESINDPRLAKLISHKLEWLTDIVFLEQKIEVFHQQFGVWPRDLAELVDKKIIEKIPQDRFGFGYYLEQNQRDFAPRIKSKPQQ